MAGVLFTTNQNSFDGPKESPEDKQQPYSVSGGVADAVAYDHFDHYTQAGDLYRLLSEEERTRLVNNIVEAMKPVKLEEIKLRQIGHFYKADPEYGTRIAEGLGLSIPQEV